MKHGLYITLCILLIAGLGCSSLKPLAIEKDIRQIIKTSPIFSTHFTGFALYEVQEERIIADIQSSKLFTPASNMKIYTMFSALHTFKDSIPSLIYQTTPKGTLVSFLGDPTFLNPSFKQQLAFDFLQRQDHILLLLPQSQPPRFGKGWAWDDFIFDYQAERCLTPIYGNMVTVIKNDSLQIIPSFFRDYITFANDSPPPARQEFFNAFSIPERDSLHVKIPIKLSNELFISLLKDTLNTTLEVTHETFLTPPDTLFSYPTDDILSAMMKPSDNFLAEQLLLMCANQNGYTTIEPFIKKVLKEWLPELESMRWVDGSGLSRYNLTSPINNVKVLNKCRVQFGMERVQTILPTGGEGTLHDHYLSDNPWIWGKTGTLSNNHNFSGYMVTTSGRLMIFSFMNNHFLTPTLEIKNEMERILQKIRDAY